MRAREIPRFFYIYTTALMVAMVLAACGKPKELVVILPGEDGNVGAVTVTDADGTLILDAPLAAALVSAQGYVKKGMVTQRDVDKTFAHVMAAQPPEPKRFLLYFKFDSAEVMPESRSVLDALFAEVASRQAVEVEITGHTDRMGAIEENDRLSYERAQAVRDMLIQRGLRASFVRVVGRGEREPLVRTPDNQAEPRNRRVEVIVR